MVGAVIYVRVSTKEQTENLSLPTQLRACEEYCRRQGYEILERFHEEGESAKTTDRSQLQNLLKYCRTRKGKVHFVVVYNLTRFAREKYDHFALRAHLKSLGISLRSATEPIDDTSLDYKQRLQQLFFPEGIAYDGNRFNRTAVTAALFNYLARSESADERVVSREGIEPSTRRLRVCCSAN
jgi:hypothetical protein